MRDGKLKTALRHAWYAGAIVPSAFMSFLMVDGYLSGKLPAYVCAIWVGACLAMAFFLVMMGPSLFDQAAPHQAETTDTHDSHNG